MYLGKNFRSFCGKPLFRWILDALLDVKQIDQILINTDARSNLLENGLAETDRIIIRDRHPNLCGDNVSMNLVIADDLENSDAETYIMTHTTNPLLRPLTIEKAIMAYQQSSGVGKADSLFSVNKHQTRFYRRDSTPINHDPNNLIPTQDLEEWFEENSCLYIFSKESFNSSNARIGTNPLIFETPKIESIDIDTHDDWDLAHALAISLHNT